jgi:phosphomecalonate degydratase small subunit
MEIKAHSISRGTAEGEALVYNGPFAFLGDLNPNTGEICLPRHPLAGKSLADKIFIFTTGKGSSGCDFAAWAAKNNGNAPAGIICMESEPVLSGAVIACGIPAVDHPEINVLEIINTGDHVKVDADSGLIIV